VRRRLLIVDDNRDFLRLAPRLLGGGGYDVVGVASNARDALATARELAPEVVLVDVNLPDASGFDLAARLARVCPGSAVLLTSTRGGGEFDELALAAGAVGFLPKDELSGAELDRLLA
jgi:CheY-like chemotaxis protein